MTPRLALVTRRSSKLERNWALGIQGILCVSADRKKMALVSAPACAHLQIQALQRS